MKKLIFILIFFVSQLCSAKDSIEISILTCSPGNEIYSAFGHSAIRIFDKENGIDKVYNFGMFDFDTPNFTLKFIKGKLKYRLGVHQTEDFINEYTRENRTVIEQKLNLDKQEKNEFLGKLNFLYRPENRYYLYSFLEKNCSTEIRDLLLEVGVKFPDHKIKKTNRELINSYLGEKLWLRFGINLMLGKSLDKKTNTLQSMFLPKFLKKQVGNSFLQGKKLVKSEQVLNDVLVKDKFNIFNWFSPVVVFTLLLLIILYWLPKPIVLMICFSIGVLGSLLSIIWIFSEHPEVKFNMNIIWCNPLYLVYIPYIIKNKSNKTLASILLVSVFVSIFIWLFGVQMFDFAVVPILFILGVINLKQLNLAHNKKDSGYPHNKLDSSLFHKFDQLLRNLMLLGKEKMKKDRFKRTLKKNQQLCL